MRSIWKWMVVGGWICLAACAARAEDAATPRSAQYEQVQQRLARGWNTWDTNSVMTHVLLPDGVAVHVSMKQRTTEGSDAYLGEALIGRQGKDVEQVFPGPHTWDGSYTELRVSWRGHNFKVQSAHDGADEVVLVSPLEPGKDAGHLLPEMIFSVGYLWSRAGSVRKQGDRIEAESPTGKVSFFLAGTDSHYLDVPLAEPYFSVELNEPVGLSTGKPRSVQQIRALVDRAQQAYKDEIAKAGVGAPTMDAIETTLGWDTIYEPEKQRVVSPVSRVWSVGWGGYVIFDWDTFFAASLAAIGDRDLAYANALETLREETPQGFVPNYARAGGWKSSDRSEPPVGAITVRDLYRRFHERWFLEDAYDPLVRWNRWWNEHRQMQGYMVWGSDGENEPRNLDDSSVGTRAGAILESGLDNSPMYDTAAYDAQTHQLEFADVGLTSMYIADCDALAEIADALGKSSDARELRERAERYRASLKTLWIEKAGIFLNKDLHTGEFSTRLSPTNFYPLLARVATPQQADRMIREHLKNPQEFWGDWILPSIARNDPAFKDQDYWRGRIWGPMNFLVYLGLRNYPQPEVRKQFAQKSMELFQKEWTANGHVHENYNAITGTGDDVANSDRFYHWGALLGLIEYMELNPGAAGAASTQ